MNKLEHSNHKRQNFKKWNSYRVEDSGARLNAGLKAGKSQNDKERELSSAHAFVMV